jgi:hypothetical protein
MRSTYCRRASINNQAISVFNSSLYLFGGIDWSIGRCDSITDYCSKYDIFANKWSVITPSKDIDTRGRFRATTVTIGDRYIYVMGGKCVGTRWVNSRESNQHVKCNDVLVLGTITNTWCQLPETPSNLGIMAGAVCCNQGLTTKNALATLCSNSVNLPEELAQIIVTACAIFADTIERETCVRFVHLDNDSKMWKTWWELKFPPNISWHDNTGIVQDNLTGFTYCLATSFSQEIHVFCLDVDHKTIVFDQK